MWLCRRRLCKSAARHRHTTPWVRRDCRWFAASVSGVGLPCSPTRQPLPGSRSSRADHWMIRRGSSPPFISGVTRPSLGTSCRMQRRACREILHRVETACWRSRALRGAVRSSISDDRYAVRFADAAGNVIAITAATTQTNPATAVALRRSPRSSTPIATPIGTRRYACAVVPTDPSVWISRK